MSSRRAVLRHILRLSWRADRRTVLGLCVLMAGQAGMVAAIGLSQRWLVDTALGGQVLAVVAAVVIGALALGLGAAAGRFEVNMRLYLIDRVQLALNQEVLHVTAAIPTVGHLEQPDYLDRLERLRWGTWTLASSIWQVAATVAATISVLATAALLAAVDPVLCLLALFAVPSLLTSRRSARIMRDMYDSRAELDRLEYQWHELSLRPEAGKELYISGAGPELDRRAGELWRRGTAKELTAQFRAAGWELVGWCCFVIGFFAALLAVAGQVAEGAATLGEAVLVISLASQLQGQLGLVVGEVGQLAAAGHVIDHYSWLRGYAAGEERGNEPPPRRLDDGIVLRDVSFRYPGAESDTLRGIDLHLPAGTTVAVVGVNGVGKTTLVKLLTGMYRPTSGTITADGRPIAAIAPAAWRTGISAVFQDFVRFQFKAREVVGVGEVTGLRDDGAVRAALARAGAAGLEAELPHGLDTQLGTAFDGIEPSLGQWQKLALARALMRRTPLLAVLDEPTAALDPHAEHELFARFATETAALAARCGAITLFVSHRFSTVRMADLIVVLSEGRVVEAGSHAELMARDGTYADLYRVQAAAYAVD